VSEGGGEEGVEVDWASERRAEGGGETFPAVSERAQFATHHRSGESSVDDDSDPDLDRLLDSDPDPIKAVNTPEVDFEDEAERGVSEELISGVLGAAHVDFDGLLSQHSTPILDTDFGGEEPPTMNTVDPATLQPASDQIEHQFNLMTQPAPWSSSSGLSKNKAAVANQVQLSEASRSAHDPEPSMVHCIVIDVRSTWLLPAPSRLEYRSVPVWTEGPQRHQRRTGSAKSTAGECRISLESRDSFPAEDQSSPASSTAPSSVERLSAELTGLGLFALETAEELAKPGAELAECEAASRSISPSPSSQLAPPTPGTTGSTMASHRHQSIVPPDSSLGLIRASPFSQAVTAANEFTPGLDPHFAAKFPRCQPRAHTTGSGAMVHFSLATTPRLSNFMGILAGLDGSSQAIFHEPYPALFDLDLHAASVAKMQPGAQGWLPMA